MKWLYPSRLRAAFFCAVPPMPLPTLRAFVKWIAVALAVFLLVYPLPLGPVAYLCHAGHMGESTFNRLTETVYAPCRALFHHSRLYQRYILWCAWTGVDEHTRKFGEPPGFSL
jgi:hypothetical protein